MEKIAPSNAADEVKWNGWGYSDTRFVVNKDGVVELTGKIVIVNRKCLHIDKTLKKNKQCYKRFEISFLW
jgi:hypothetical protein